MGYHSDLYFGLTHTFQQSSCTKGQRRTRRQPQSTAHDTPRAGWRHQHPCARGQSPGRGWRAGAALSGPAGCYGLGWRPRWPTACCRPQASSLQVIWLEQLLKTASTVSQLALPHVATW